MLDEAFDNSADVLTAEDVEAGGVPMAVNDVGIVQMEKGAYIAAAVPIEIDLLDSVNVGMAANAAFAAVAFEAGNGFAAGVDFGFGGRGDASAAGFLGGAGVFFFEVGGGYEWGFVLHRRLAGGG